MQSNLTTYKKYFSVVASYILTTVILLSQLQTKATAYSAACNNFSSATSFSLPSYYAQHDSKTGQEITVIAEFIAEVNEEEDAEVGNLELDHSIKGYSIFEEHVYTAYIQSQLFHQKYSISEKQQVPLFLFHHSWKSHLA